MKIITLIFAMFIAFNADSQSLGIDSIFKLPHATHYGRPLTSYDTTYIKGLSFATDTAASLNIVHNKIHTSLSVIDNKGITVASIDTSGILTVIDSLATIKAFFSEYGFKINGYKQKYYYNWAYQTDNRIIMGSDFIQAPSLPTKNYIIKHTHLFDTLDKDKLVIVITPIKNPAY